MPGFLVPLSTREAFQLPDAGETTLGRRSTCSIVTLHIFALFLHSIQFQILVVQILEIADLQKFEEALFLICLIQVCADETARVLLNCMPWMAGQLRLMRLMRILNSNCIAPRSLDRP